MNVKPGNLIKYDNEQFKYVQKSNPQSSGLDFLTYGNYIIKPDGVSDILHHPDEEAVLFLMEGKTHVKINDKHYSLEHYDTLYIPKATSYQLKNLNSHEDAMIIICKSLARTQHEVFHSKWKEFSVNENRIRHLKGKDVFLMFDVTEKADRLMAGYTIYEPNVRAWPAHNHKDQEEVYIFTKGQGSMEVYADEETKTFVHNVKQYDAVTIPLHNYHPVFSQDQELHFIWCIAGERYWVGDKNKDFMKGNAKELST